MRRRPLPLALLALLALQALLSPGALAQVPRHPSQFEGTPLVEGYRLVPLVLAPAYYRLVEAALRIAATYNVTSISLYSYACDIVYSNGSVTLYYAAVATARARGGGTIVYSTPGQGLVPASTPLEPRSVEAEPGGGAPGAALVADLVGSAAGRLVDIMREGLNASGSNGSLGGLREGESIVLALAPSAGNVSLAGLVNASLRLGGVSVSLHYRVLSYTVRQGENASTLLFWLPCQPLLAEGEPLPVLPERWENTSLAALALEAVAASLYNASVGGETVVCARVPIINPGLLLSAGLARGLLGAGIIVAPGGGGGNASLPGVNVTIDEILKNITNGSEEEARRALELARQLEEEGAINATQLEKLRKLFIERFGYDPFAGNQTGGQQAQGPGGRGGAPGTSIVLDLDNLLQSVQSLTGEQLQAAQPGGQGLPGPGGLPGLRVRLPGERQALLAALAGSLAVLAGMVFQARSEIVFTARSIAGRPPPGLTGREMAEWCYAAVLRLLELRGLPKMPWETPREYLARAAPLLGPLAGSLEELTRAYEAAVYRMEEVPRGASLSPCRRLVKALRNPLTRIPVKSGEQG